MKSRKSTPKALRTVQKKTAEVFGAIEQWLNRMFHFVTVWQKAVGTWFRRLGRKISDNSPNWLKRVGRTVRKPFARLNARRRNYLKRRPHRSFLLTRRRDYKRSLKMPGYWSFTNSVRAMLWRHKKLFGGLMLTYFLAALAIGGFGQQDAYLNLSETLNETGKEVFTGNLGAVSQAGLLLATSVSTGLTPNVTEAQSVLSALAAFFAWLATVWALRNVMADRSIRVRDAVYSSGSPVLSTVIVAFTLVFQMLPISIAFLVYNAAITSGLISGGVEQMLAWIVIVLLGVLSLYWITSTIIALVVVTLPGMYPFQAIRTAGDLVIGRRIRVLLRLIWGALLTVVLWALVVIPVILADASIKQAWPAVEWLPIVPTVIMAMSAVTIVALAAYVYMLYRKVVDDDAGPA